MRKKDVINEIKEFANSGKYSEILIQRCLDIVDKMYVTPRVREVFDDEDILKYGIAFDCNKNDLSVEITLFNDEIQGYTSYLDMFDSAFFFESDEFAINFWNVILGKEF